MYHPGGLRGEENMGYKLINSKIIENHKQLTKMRTVWVTALELSVEKKINKQLHVA
jgi:hypothetical protein